MKGHLLSYKMSPQPKGPVFARSYVSSAQHQAISRNSNLQSLHFSLTSENQIQPLGASAENLDFSGQEVHDARPTVAASGVTPIQNGQSSADAVDAHLRIGSSDRTSRENLCSPKSPRARSQSEICELEELSTLHNLTSSRESKGDTLPHHGPKSVVRRRKKSETVTDTVLTCFENDDHSPISTSSLSQEAKDNQEVLDYHAIHGRTQCGPLSRKRKLEPGSAYPSSVEHSKANLAEEDEQNGMPHLACPFYKRDSLKHSVCYKYRLKGMNRVKFVSRERLSRTSTNLNLSRQHLNRKHQKPIHCDKCFLEFDESKERKHHIRMNTCNVLPEKSWDAVTEDQSEKLKKRIRGKTTEQKWYDVFKLLFPNAKKPESPCRSIFRCLLE
jgi:hypothetical protein